MSTTYTLTVRRDDAFSQSLPRQPLRDRLARIPTLEAQGGDLYHFGEPDEHGVMRIELCARDARLDSDRFDAIEVVIPRSWVHARGPQVFALVFMMAEWNQWTVYDEQIRDTLQKEAVLQGLVAMRQAQLQKEGRGGPPGTQAHFVEEPSRDDGSDDSSR
jgi:hypothetical protein